MLRARAERPEGGKARREVGHALTQDVAGLQGLASKPGHVRCGRIAEVKGTWCHYEACVEASKDVKAACPSDVSMKTWTVLPLRGYVS